MSTREPLPECLDDLDLLLLPECERARLRVRVDLHAEHVRQLGEPSPRARPRPAVGLRSAPSMRFSSTRQRRDERRGAGTPCRCPSSIAARGESIETSRPSTRTRPASGLIAAPRGCSSASTCRRRSRRAGTTPPSPGDKVDVVVCDDAREGLGDTDQLDRGGAGSRPSLSASTGFEGPVMVGREGRRPATALPDVSLPEPYWPSTSASTSSSVGVSGISTLPSADRRLGRPRPRPRRRPGSCPSGAARSPFETLRSYPCSPNVPACDVGDRLLEDRR